MSRALVTKFGDVFYQRADGLFWYPGTGARQPFRGWTEQELRCLMDGWEEADMECPPDSAFGD